MRAEQFWQLWQGFSDSPFVGHGFGATVAQVRDPLRPWAYELSYMDLLFTTGIVGGALYLFALSAPAAKLVSATRRAPWLAPYATPVLAGWVAFLVANATNPYLDKFDSLWVVFLPAALLNVMAGSRDTDPSQGASEYRSFAR
ncbi:hypothetical protein GCM10009817_02340 [Terrabacter lapilli]|uniref:Uncharacterized protein n=1 Tax=Terrabacter lapilli TaxID=436231 RepID=A0ABN2RAN7_9MICO